MIEESLHKDTRTRLEYFHSVKKIPNIIFHGPNGSGKRTIIKNFVSLIYNDDKEKIKNFVMYVNCAYGKGIKFIRDELKFFAKTHIQSNGGNTFKSIILLNADKLTTDAQSALRRCIELYNHTTRFFIIVEDKYKILKPILSRFCEIYVPNPIINGKIVNLYSHNLSTTFPLKSYETSRIEWLKKEVIKTEVNTHKIMDLSLKLYEKGYTALDLLELLKKEKSIFDSLDEIKVHELLVGFNKVKTDIKSEKLLIYFVLHFIYFNKETSLEYISYI
jgi:Cdc6-like AAA superfamily ATPase